MNDLVKKGYEKAADIYAEKRNQLASLKYLELLERLVKKGRNNT